MGLKYLLKNLKNRVNKLVNEDKVDCEYISKKPERTLFHR